MNGKKAQVPNDKGSMTEAQVLLIDSMLTEMGFAPQDYFNARRLGIAQSPGKYLTVPEAAQIARLGTRTLFNKIAEHKRVYGKIPEWANRGEGRRTRIDRAKFLEWMEGKPKRKRGRPPH